MPRNRVYRLPRTGNYRKRTEPTLVDVSAYSKAWSCLFPQHGPGKKHERPIVLVAWQRELVEHNAQLLLRGLIHSDGCRFINTGRNGWTCPRYLFSNKSEDILQIFTEACDVVGLRYTFAPQAVYVSRRLDVATMDEFIGPKL